ncbi:MAG: DUF2953 domain-containing protein [Sporolactobacillus sp.]
MILLVFLAICFCVASLLLILFLKSSLTVRISVYADLNSIRVKLGLIIQRKEWRSFEWDETDLEQLLNNKPIHPIEWMDKLDEENNDRSLWQRRLRVTDFVWITSVGTGEADQAALLCGLIWSIKCALLPFFSEWLNDPPPRLKVVPLFHERQLQTRLSCMISCHVGQAIGILWQIRQQMKEGKKDGGTSDTRINEDSARQSSGND